MSWKKNAFSYICWFVYAVLTGTALLCLTGYTSEAWGLSVYWGILFAVMYALCAAVVVVFLHRISMEVSAYFAGRRLLEGLAKAVLITILSTIGVYLQLRTVESLEVLTSSQALDFMVRLIAQIVIAFGLFFLLNKLSGFCSGLIVFGFVMCAPGWLNMLHTMENFGGRMATILLLMMWFIIFITGYKNKLYPALYVIWGGVTGYLLFRGIIGFVLLVSAVSLIYVERQIYASRERKRAALLCFILGFVLVFGGCVFLLSFTSGTHAPRLLSELIYRYYPGPFSVPAIVDSSFVYGDTFVLVGLMTFGIFSFWYDIEKDTMSVGTIIMVSWIVMSCFGMLSDISTSPGIYLVMVIMAGVSVQQCVCGVCVPKEILLPESVLEEVAALYEPETIYEEAVCEPEPVREAVSCEPESVSEEIPYEAEEDIPYEEDIPFETEEMSAGMQVEPEKKTIQFIENPLPLPKKHEKKKLDYNMQVAADKDDFDVQVSEEDDFDI